MPAPAAALDRFVSVNEAARLAGFHPDTIYDRIAAGKLQRYGSRNCTRIWLRDLLVAPDSSVTRRKQVGGPPAVAPARPPRKNRTGETGPAAALEACRAAGCSVHQLAPGSFLVTFDPNVPVGAADRPNEESITSLNPYNL